MLKPPFRLAIVSDYLEENWPSMDLVADMLVAHLTRDHSSEVTVTQLRPPMRRLFSFLGTKTFRNVDRFLNRFYCYPRWLRKRKDEFDLFHIIDHSYAHLALELPPERVVITCHDLDTFRPVLDTGRRYPHAWYRRFIRRTLEGLRSAPHILCVSESTRNSLLLQDVVPDSRTTVIYYGVHPSFVEKNRDADEDIGRLLPHDGEICLLSVGSTIPRKRVDVLLRVFAAVRRQEPGAKLVRVGGVFTPSQQQLADELDLNSSIVVFPFLQASQLSSVYRRATLLLQTSEYEGFGLPLIEAMACGCPVVASDIPALREVGGPATTLCPLADIDQWTGEILRLLRERRDSPDAWADRRNASAAWASRFTWEENARRTLEIYDQLMEPHRWKETQVR